MFGRFGTRNVVFCCSALLHAANARHIKHLKHVSALHSKWIVSELTFALRRNAFCQCFFLATLVRCHFGLFLVHLLLAIIALTVHWHTSCDRFTLPWYIVSADMSLLRWLWQSLTLCELLPTTPDQRGQLFRHVCGAFTNGLPNVYAASINVCAKSKLTLRFTTYFVTTLTKIDEILRKPWRNHQFDETLTKPWRNLDETLTKLPPWRNLDETLTTPWRNL